MFFYKYNVCYTNAMTRFVFFGPHSIYNEKTKKLKKKKCNKRINRRIMV